MWELVAVVLVLLVVLGLGLRMEIGAFLRQIDRAPSPASRGGFLARIRRRLFGDRKRSERQE